MSESKPLSARGLEAVLELVVDLRDDKGEYEARLIERLHSEHAALTAENARLADAYALLVNDNDGLERDLAEAREQLSDFNAAGLAAQDAAREQQAQVRLEVERLSEEIGQATMAGGGVRGRVQAALEASRQRRATPTAQQSAPSEREAWDPTLLRCRQCGLTATMLSHGRCQRPSCTPSADVLAGEPRHTHEVSHTAPGKALGLYVQRCKCGAFRSHEVQPGLTAIEVVNGEWMPAAQPRAEERISSERARAAWADQYRENRDGCHVTLGVLDRYLTQTEELERRARELCERWRARAEKLDSRGSKFAYTGETDRNRAEAIEECADALAELLEPTGAKGGDRG